MRHSQAEIPSTTDCSSDLGLWPKGLHCAVVWAYPVDSAAGGVASFSRTVPMFLLALRMPNAETTSNTPMTISQTPTTRVRAAIDSNGDASITTPAIRL